MRSTLSSSVKSSFSQDPYPSRGIMKIQPQAALAYLLGLATATVLSLFHAQPQSSHSAPRLVVEQATRSAAAESDRGTEKGTSYATGLFTGP